MVNPEMNQSSLVASLINLAMALLLMRVGRESGSITLEANARHLLTDVWTSAGVLAGVGLVALTSWNRLDPIVALLVAANIVWTGIAIVRRSVAGLMDQALPIKEQEIVKQILSKYKPEGIQCHDLRTRQSATHRFVSVHVLTPGAWTAKQAHDLLARLEEELGCALPNLTVFTHPEPLKDPASARKHCTKWPHSSLMSAPDPAIDEQVTWRHSPMRPGPRRPGPDESNSHSKSGSRNLASVGVSCLRISGKAGKNLIANKGWLHSQEEHTSVCEDPRPLRAPHNQ